MPDVLDGIFLGMPVTVPGGNEYEVVNVNKPDLEVTLNVPVTLDEGEDLVFEADSTVPMDVVTLVNTTGIYPGMEVKGQAINEVRAYPPQILLDGPINPSTDEILEFTTTTAQAEVKYEPSNLMITFENLLEASKQLTMSPSFTNMMLEPGLSVFGDGVLPGTVITRVLPGPRK